MSVSKYRWTEACEGQPCPGDCDLCSKEPEAKNDDLISRQAAIDTLDKILPVDPMRNEYTQGITCGAALAIEYIKQLPSAQPEIVRCKDCKKYKTKYCVMDIWHEDVTIYRATPEDYCSKAERRE